MHFIFLCKQAHQTPVCEGSIPAPWVLSPAGSLRLFSLFLCSLVSSLECPQNGLTLTKMQSIKHRTFLGGMPPGDRQMGEGVYKVFVKKKVHPPETSVLVTTSSMFPGNACNLDQATTFSASVLSPKLGRLAVPICLGYRENNWMSGNHFGKQQEYSSFSILQGRRTSV